MGFGLTPVLKDLRVKSFPPMQMDEQLHNDPAIIQSQFSGVPLGSSPSTSIGGRASIESPQRKDTPALAIRAHQSALPSHLLAYQVDPSNHSQAAENTGSPLFSTPLYCHGCSRALINVSQTQQNISFQSPPILPSPMTTQGPGNSPDLHSSPIIGLINSPEPVNSMLSSITSSSSHSTVAGSFTPAQCSMSPSMPSCSPIRAQASQAAHLSLTMTSFPSSFEDTNITELQPVGKVVNSPAGDAYPSSVLPNSMPFHACSSCSLQASSPSSLTPGQLAQTGSNVISSTQNTYPGHKDTTAFASGFFHSPSVNSAQQSLYSTQFTEEFDFEGMYEKFKKDEPWGYLGKEKDYVSGHSLVDIQALGILSKFDPKPAYMKDELYDTISCNSHPHVNHGPFSGYGAGRSTYN
ncbi:Decapping 5-like, putative isoform 2 [Hibiscus syriacus]|uniref:Decapping 5-like, putative isoform 2 n=1 Tax=Hibiscus syriacus TaxID=106335 RepID=A0A6A2ZF85_HIBSY|nr:Decapping 5-like, putative isoform 2 [Hibiscus syriacus]